MKNFAPTISFILGLLSILLILLSGPGTRIGLFPFTAGLLMIFIGSVTGLVALIMAAAGLATGSPKTIYHAIGLLTGALSFGLIAFTVWNGRNAPAIHEISTDTVNPPKFVAVLPLRKNALNPSEYGGEEVAKKQAAAFPDIKPLHLPIPPAEAFKKALNSVQTMKWSLVDSSETEGRIEAFDTTFWFGFKDDVVIRIQPEGNGSLVDIRSDSRVGGGDLGTNAKRVRKFLALMNR